MNWIRR